MKAYLAIPLFTAMTHLIGSAFLFAVVSGSTGFFASPLLAIFGWFFLIPEAFVVTAQWGLLTSARLSTCCRTWLLTVPAPTLLIAAFGPKELGDETNWACGYALGTVIAATCSLLAVRWAKFLTVPTEFDTNDVAHDAYGERS
jgi:hypothetical protein